MKHANQMMIDFDGITYRRGLDQSRLNSQLNIIKSLLSGGNWITLSDLARQTGFPESSISARIRDLRKPHIAGLNIERRRKPGSESRGIWQYRIGKKGQR